MSKKHPGPSWPYEKRNLPHGRWAATGHRHGGDPEPDEVAVQRLLRGDCEFLHYPADRNEALDRADIEGVTSRQVAERLGCTTRTVQRRRTWRARHGIPRRKR